MASRRRKSAPRSGRDARPGARNTTPGSAPDDSLGGLGDALRRAGLTDKTPKAARARRAAPAPPPQPPPPPEPPPRRRLTPEQAMAEAFAQLDDPTAWARKFDDGLPCASPLPEDVDVIDADPARDAPADDDPDTETDPLTDDDLLFLEAVGTEVRRLEQAREALARHAFVGVAWHTARQLETLTNDDLHEPTLTGGQRDLLRRSRRGGKPMPVLNIRHQRRREALGEVEAFVFAQRREGVRFVRVVTGKGRQSRDGDPVLKRTLLAWCAEAGEAHVLAHAPETDQSGRYGSLVLELRPWHRSTP